jgi:amylosucrase
MIKIMIFLGNKGIDVLRLDAVPFLWKRLGTNSQNEPEAHTILQAMRACTKVVMPGVLFKSEAIVQPNDIVKYLGQGNTPVEECEIGYNASLMVFLWDAIATKNTRLLTKGLETMPRIPKGSTWINYLRCHDDIGLGFSDADAESVGYNPNLHRRFLVDYYTGKFYGSYATGAPFMYNPKTGEARISGSLASLAGLEKAMKENNKAEIEKAKKKILMLHSVIMAFGGVPLIYYGDELATINDYSYMENDSQKGDNRWMHRPVINWKNAEKRNVSGTIEYEIFNGIKKMIEIRKETKEFYGENDYEIIYTENQSVFSFLREKEDEKTLVVVNFSDSPQKINSEVLKKSDFEGKIIDIFSGNTIELMNNEIEIGEYNFMWIKEAK